jgi:hypothetical protein
VYTPTVEKARPGTTFETSCVTVLDDEGVRLQVVKPRRTNEAEAMKRGRRI